MLSHLWRKGALAIGVVLTASGFASAGTHHSTRDRSANREAPTQRSFECWRAAQEDTDDVCFDAVVLLSQRVEVYEAPGDV